MNKRFVVLLFVSVVASASWNSKYLPRDQMEQKWGRRTFSAEIFRKSDDRTRSAMTADLIRRDVYKNQKLSQIEKDLGPATAKSDLAKAVAYKLESDADSEYNLVFLPEFEGKRVEDIEVERLTKATVDTPSNLTSVGDSMIPVVIEGKTASQIFTHMNSPVNAGGEKSSKQIRCSNSKCTIYVHADGSIGF